jgi:pimeloyl-ACP methyl ester carboxylesterase
MNRRNLLQSLSAAIPLALTTTACAAPSAAPAPASRPPILQPLDLPKPWTSSGRLRRAGGVLHYATMGRNEDLPPIILLHKLGGWMADWRDVASILAENRRIIAFDLPGHGESEWNGPPPRVQTVFETAALIVGALQEFKLGPVDIAGTSLGGCIGVAIAALYPDRIRRLALPSCVLGRASSEDAVAKKEADQAHFWTADGLPLPVDPEFSRQMFGLTNYQKIAFEQDHSRERAGLWIKPQERGVAFTDFLELLPRIEAPTRLFTGDQDHFFAQYQAPALQRLRRGSAHVIAGASGLHVQDQPQETAAALAEFFSS